MTRTAPSRRIALPPGWEAVERVHQAGDRSIWRIENRRADRTEILKLVETGADASARSGIAEEFLLLERIRHPHWVRPYGFLHLKDGSLGYRMEDIPGSAAADATPVGWAPRDLGAVREVLGALATLHAIGYVHLDLKPAQILRGPRGTCLVDPGLAAPRGATLPARGTWGFIAPEILAQRAWDHRADLYSLGCVLVQLWTGENPLGEGGIADQLRRVGERPRLHLRERIELPEGLDRVVEQFLDPDPLRRPADAAQAWRDLHTMAGDSSRYLEHRRLPPPDDLPFYPPPGVEDAWDEALEGNGPGRWVITGPVGSGRRRLVQRLQARAEAAGGLCSGTESSLRVTVWAGNGRARGEIDCRIGSPQTGERSIELGAIGREGARAALEAYGLEPEGEEAAWTPLLLRLRLEERFGEEAQRRASSRKRRSIAAAAGAGIGPGEREILAEALVASTVEERPLARTPEPLADGGWVRLDGDRRLVPMIPPWDEEALQVLVGPEALAAAHRRLLARGSSDPVVAAEHALGGGETDAVRTLLLPAVERLRRQGRLTQAGEFLQGARPLLGSSFPDAWVALHARLAIEGEDPAQALPLLSLKNPGLTPDWRDLVSAHLDRRADRLEEALAATSRLLAEGRDPTARRLARIMTAKILCSLGRPEEAIEIGLSLLDETPELPAPEAVALYSVLLDSFSQRGRPGDETAKIRELCERAISTAGVRERCLASATLGGDAFRRGDLPQAKRFLEEAAAAAREWGDLSQTAICEINLAGVYFEEGRLAESEAMNRRAMVLSDQVGDEALAARTRLNIAAILHGAGRWGEALLLARQARHGLEAIGAQDNAAAAQMLEAAALVETGLCDAAESVAQEVERRLAERPQPILSGVLWRDRGRIARWNGRIGEARECWDRSVAVARAAGAADEEARTLLEQACAEIAAGAPSTAEEQIERAGAALGERPGIELAVRRDFAEAMLRSLRRGAAAGLEMPRDLLRRAAGGAAGAGLRGWSWRCHAACAGLCAALDDDSGTVQALRLAEEGLRELLGSIGTEALQESHLLLPDPLFFIHWLEQRSSDAARLPFGSSDLEVFFR